MNQQIHEVIAKNIKPAKEIVKAKAQVGQEAQRRGISAHMALKRDLA